MLIAVVTAVLGLVMSATPAGAAHKDGTLESGELGLFYLQNSGLPVFDLYYSDDDFRDDVFPGTTIPADNNTESYDNWDSYYWYVFTGVGYTGSWGCIPPGTSGNFSSTFRNTVSSAYYSSTSC